MLAVDLCSSTGPLLSVKEPSERPEPCNASLTLSDVAMTVHNGAVAALSFGLYDVLNSWRHDGFGQRWKSSNPLGSVHRSSCLPHASVPFITAGISTPILPLLPFGRMRLCVFLIGS